MSVRFRYVSHVSWILASIMVIAPILDTWLHQSPTFKLSLKLNYFKAKQHIIIIYIIYIILQKLSSIEILFNYFK